MSVLFWGGGGRQVWFGVYLSPGLACTVLIMLLEYQIKVKDEWPQATVPACNFKITDRVSQKQSMHFNLPYTTVEAASKQPTIFKIIKPFSYHLFLPVSSNYAWGIFNYPQTVVSRRPFANSVEASPLRGQGLQRVTLAALEQIPGPFTPVKRQNGSRGHSPEFSWPVIPNHQHIKQTPPPLNSCSNSFFSRAGNDN